MVLPALLVAAAVAAAPLETRQPAPARGALTAVGFGLMGVGGAAIGLGVAGLFQAIDADRLYKLFEGQPSIKDVEAYTLVVNRYRDGTGLAIGGFIVGGLSLVASVVCLVLDAPPPAATISFAPAPGGGSFVFSARF